MDQSLRRTGRSVILALGIGYLAAAASDSGNRSASFDVVTGLPVPAAAPMMMPGAHAAISKLVVSAYSRLPIRFEPNVGQAPSGIRYLARCDGFDIALTEKGVTLIGERDLLRLSPVRAGATPRLRGEKRQVSISNYFIGNDRSKWRTDVANYGSVRYRGVYPGIDWVIHGNPEQLEYDLLVAPRADPKQIKLKIEGADRVTVSRDGDLLFDIRGHAARQLKPVIYQATAAGGRRRIEGGFVLDHEQVSFAIGKYDRSRELVIDPIFVYSTYLGGSQGGIVSAVAADESGNAYVVGSTSSPDFPTDNPIQSFNTNSFGNAFITKFNADGTALVYSTYLGGSVIDYGAAIAVDGAGNAYVAGTTNSGDFPTVNAFQGSKPGAAAAFVAKLNTRGDALVYSTYLGGSDAPIEYGGPGGGATDATAIAVDSAGSAYVTGGTDTVNFPTVEAFQSASHAPPSSGAGSSFVTKLNAEGSALVYSTYLGGSGGDATSGIAVDTAGDAYVAGIAYSADFPVVNAFQSFKKGGEAAAFLTKFNATGNALVYSTYLGGSGEDYAYAVAVDPSGEAYVTGTTYSSDFPTMNPFQGALQGTSAGFVTKFDAAGTALVYSTYLTGANPMAIALDSDGDAFIAGYTSSSELPTLQPLQGANNGSAIGASNAFITQFGADGSELLFSTYLGGSGSEVPSGEIVNPFVPVGDSARSIAVDDAGNIYLGGVTASKDFPIFNAFQGTNDAGVAEEFTAGFVAKIQRAYKVESVSAISSPSGGGGGGAVGWDFIAVLGLALAARVRPDPRNSRGSARSSGLIGLCSPADEHIALQVAVVRGAVLSPEIHEVEARDEGLKSGVLSKRSHIGAP